VTYRSLPDADPLALYEEIKRRLGELDTHDYGSPSHVATIELGRPGVTPPMLSPRGTTLERALFEVTGANNALGAPFATDGAWFAPEGIVTLICGPGEFAQAHQPNESIAKDLFERGPAMVLKVVEQMCCREDLTQRTT
jgi:acetylornithine deacetylase/succinyl-diaminopimelate desuccinylase-like protein